MQQVLAILPRLAHFKTQRAVMWERGNALLSMSSKLSSIPLAQEYFYAKASRHPRQPLALICLGVHSSFHVSLAGSEHDQTSGTQTNGHGLAGRLVLKIIGLVSYSIKRSGGNSASSALSVSAMSSSVGICLHHHASSKSRRQHAEVWLAWPCGPAVIPMLARLSRTVLEKLKSFSGEDEVFRQYFPLRGFLIFAVRFHVIWGIVGPVPLLEYWCALYVCASLGVCEGGEFSCGFMNRAMRGRISMQWAIMLHSGSHKEVVQSTNKDISIRIETEAAGLNPGLVLSLVLGWWTQCRVPRLSKKKRKEIWSSWCWSSEIKWLKTNK